MTRQNKISTKKNVLKGGRFSCVVNYPYAPGLVFAASIMSINEFSSSMPRGGGGNRTWRRQQGTTILMPMRMMRILLGLGLLLLLVLLAHGQASEALAWRHWESRQKKKVKQTRFQVRRVVLLPTAALNHEDHVHGLVGEKQCNILIINVAFKEGCCCCCWADPRYRAIERKKEEEKRRQVD